MGLNLDWVKSYGLRCSVRPHASTKVMTKKTRKQKMQKTKTYVFVQNRRKKEMEIFAF